nr:MFS transporter [bacterium]
MPTISHIFQHVRQYGLKHKPLYALSFMVLFWSIFDGIISYVTPLVIVEHGLSKTVMGIIYGSSSVAGALFDFLLCRFFKDTHFRRVYLIMFVICFFYPFILWQASVWWLYLIAMALWGIYYDLHNFGDFDFVSRQSREEEHASSFGVIQAFRSAGYMIAPLLAGLVIGTWLEKLDIRPFMLALIFLGIAFIFYLVLVRLTRNERVDFEIKRKQKVANIDIIREIKIWKKIVILCLPVLILIMMLNVLDAFFWTIGPLIAEGITSLEGFNGLFMVAYSLPVLLIGWFIGLVTRRLGKKKTAFLSFLLGSLILSTFTLFTSPYYLIVIILLASFFFALAWPAINGAFADYIAEAPEVGKDIEGVEDLFTNIGYIIGPIIAGVLADVFGNESAFSIFGLVG